MQWNCPHCGIFLIIPAQSLGTGWSFSRCCKCSGFALIRRAEINVIKVDKAPPGEKIIVPEIAQNNFLKTDSAVTSTPPPLETTPLLAASFFTQKPKPNAPSIPSSQLGPHAISHAHAHSISQRTTSLAAKNPQNIRIKIPSFSALIQNLDHKMIFAGTCAVVSGYLLLAQGRSLWSKLTPEAVTSVEANDVRFNQAGNATEDTTSTPASASVSTTSALTRDKEEKAGSSSPVHTLFVKSRLARVHIHSGPGADFPVIASTDMNARYMVHDWNNRWLKISLVSQNSNQEIGWIRNDLVQVLSEVSGKGVTSPKVNPLN